MRAADTNLVQRGLEEVLEMPETLALVSEDCKDSSMPSELDGSSSLLYP